MGGAPARFLPGRKVLAIISITGVAVVGYLFKKQLGCSWASLMAQMVKNPLAMQETQVRSLGWEDPLEEGMATYSTIAAAFIVAKRQEEAKWPSNNE